MKTKTTFITHHFWEQNLLLFSSLRQNSFLKMFIFFFTPLWLNATNCFSIYWKKKIDLYRKKALKMSLWKNQKQKEIDFKTL